MQFLWVHERTTHKQAAASYPHQDSLIPQSEDHPSVLDIPHTCFRPACEISHGNFIYHFFSSPGSIGFTYNKQKLSLVPQCGVGIDHGFPVSRQAFCLLFSHNCSCLSSSLQRMSQKDDSYGNNVDFRHSFLTRHVPGQITNSRKLCYRHRPDLTRKRMPDSFDFEDVQRQMESLPTSDREAITHIWSLFSAAPADQRTLILKGLLSACCMPQLSFLYDEIKPLLRIDFSSILPREISLRIFSFLDAKSLCHAAQVSQAWRSLADDDALWHRMCEQHIDKKCTKCGWGLPLLDKRPKRRSANTKLTTVTDGMPLRTACGPATVPDEEVGTPPKKRVKTDAASGQGTSVEAFEGKDLYPGATTSSSAHNIVTQPSAAAPPQRRPWKEVYSERLVVERNWRRNNYNVRILQGHTDGVMCVQFCDTNNVVMTGSYDKTIRVWSLETGEELRRMEGHRQCVRALQFDNCKLVTGAMDNTLKIWDWHSGRCIRTLEGHTGGVLSLHFDSRLLASGSTDHTIRVWDFRAGACCTLTGHNEWVNCVRICSHDNNLLVSASDDSTIKVWDLQSKACIQTLQGHVGQVQVALPSPKGFNHRLWPDPAREQQQQQQQEISNESSQHRIDRLSPFQPACASENSTSSSRLPGNVHPHDPKVHSLSDAPIIVSAALDNTIKFWNFSGSCLRTLFGHVEGVWALAFDSLRVVSGSHDRTVRIWDMESGKCMHALEGHSGPVTTVALSDTKLISASDDGEVRIWDFGPNH